MKFSGFILLGCVALLGIAELAARLAHPLLVKSVPAYYYRQYFSALIETSPVLVWAGRPGANAELANSRGEQIEYRINALGWRGRPFTPLDQPANALVMGDSFSFGTGVKESAVYSQELERRTRGLNVWNLGQMGYAPDQYMLLSQRWLTAFPWKFLVVQLSNNDLADVAGHNWKNINSGSGIPAVIEPPASHSWFSGSSEAWNLIANWHLQLSNAALGEKELQQGLERLLHSLKTIFILSKERKISVVLLQASDWGGPMYGEKMGAAYQNGVRALAVEFSTPLVETRDAELLPFPDLHWTEGAHKKAAESVMGVLGRN